MGMSSYVVGIREPDEKWKKFKKIIDSLEAAGMSWEDAPEEVTEFFGWEPPDPKGIVVDLKRHECCEKHNEEMEDGFLIDISKLPSNITHIRFVNSY